VKRTTYIAIFAAGADRVADFSWLRQRAWSLIVEGASRVKCNALLIEEDTYITCL